MMQFECNMCGNETRFVLKNHIEKFKIIKDKILLYLLFLLSIVIIQSPNVSAWSNGGYSDDPLNPDYGTHDWIAQHALDWLPSDEKQYITDNLNEYLYGTELPDNNQADDGFGDTGNHHFYFNIDGSVKADNSADRAQTEYNEAKSFLEDGYLKDASKQAGIVSHYIVDLAVFGHTMGKYTDWEAEEHHSDYESYVKNRMTSYTSDEFDHYLVFDGSLDSLSPYDGTEELARLITFGDGNYLQNSTWMDKNYDWGNETFHNSSGSVLNYSVNILADVLHTLAIQSGYQGEGGEFNIEEKVVFTEVYYDVDGDDDLGEWIELFNPTPEDININNWVISDNNGDYTFSSGTIKAYSYFTVAKDSSDFNSNYGKNPDKGDVSFALANNGDYLTLKDDLGADMDFVAWEKGGSSEPYSQWTVKAGEGLTIKRSDHHSDSDSNSDWVGDRSQDPQTSADGANPPPKEEENQPPSAIISVDNSTLFLNETLVLSGGLSSDPESDPISYSWDIDSNDGVEDYINGEMINVIYNRTGQYTITLQVSDTEGNTNETTILISVVENNPPFARITVVKNSKHVSRPYILSGNNSYDPENDSLTYTWFVNFNESELEVYEGSFLYYEFQQSGEYTFLFVVSDSKGNSDQIEFIKIVTDNIALAVYVSSSAIINNTYVNEMIHFSGITFDESGYPLTYLWDFGDGNTSTQRNTTHKYLHDGTYNISFTVTDSLGEINSTSFSLKIKPEIGIDGDGIGDNSDPYPDDSSYIDPPDPREKDVAKFNLTIEEQLILGTCCGSLFLINIVIGLFIFKDGKKRKAKKKRIWLIIGFVFGILALIFWYAFKPKIEK